MQEPAYPDAGVGPVVVTLPAEIDMTCVEQVGAELAAAFSPGTRGVIADMTATTFCDSAGIRMLLLAHTHAADNGAKLVLVAPGAAVRRIFELTGFESLMPVHTSLRAAVSELQDD